LNYNTFQEPVIDEDPDFTVTKHKKTVCEGLLDILFSNPLNILLLAVFPSIGLYYGNAPASVTFIFATISLAPLSERVGFVAEELGYYFNARTAGAVWMILGNMTEFIVGGAAIHFKLYRFLFLYLVGSILSNSMFILGSSFFLAGLKYKHVEFRNHLSHINAALYFFFPLCVVAPTTLQNEDEATSIEIINLSRAFAVMILIVYASFAFYQVLFIFLIILIFF
jgi:Ca2+:H+ antiporter